MTAAIQGQESCEVTNELFPKNGVQLNIEETTIPHNIQQNIMHYMLYSPLRLHVSEF